MNRFFPGRVFGVGLALAALAVGPAFGQATAPATGSESKTTTLEKFFVNDNKVLPFSSANVDLPRTMNDVQPYFIFDAKELEMSGAGTIGEFLELYLPMNSSSASVNQNAFVGGASSYPNLRGLGTDGTLMLINGRRAPAGVFALNGGSSQANLNNIPPGSVDRIEILPASAAAIYGGNAVGGVINVITKRNYTGGQIRAVYQNPEDTDAPIRRIEMNYGFALEGGRTRVTLASSYFEIKPLLYKDRSFFRANEDLVEKNLGLLNQGALPAAATPGILNTNPTVNLVLKNGGGSIGSPVTFVPFGIAPTTPAATLAAGLRANAGHYNRDQAPDSRQVFGGPSSELDPGRRAKNFTVTIRREMNENLELNLDFAINGAIHLHNASYFTGQRVAADAPSNPFTTAVNVFPAIPGDWVDQSNAISRAVTIGFVQKLPREWRVQGDYTWNNTSNAFSSPNAVSPSTAEITVALSAGRLNPFVDTLLYPFDVTPYRGLQTYVGKGGSNNVAIRAAGPTWRLPGGAPLVRLGLERVQTGEKDSVRYTNFENFPNRNLALQALGKNQITRSAYLGVHVPVVGEANRLSFVRQLDLQIDARTDDYDVRTGTGQITLLPVPVVTPVIRSNRARYVATNPTYGLSYRPVGWLMLRASVGRGFSPPRYTQLTLDPTPSPGTVNVVDPRRGGTRTPVFTIGGGNPDLSPQSSETTTAGAIIEPTSGLLKGLRISVDYNFTRQQNLIGALSPQLIVDLEERYPDRVVRGALVPGDPFGVGPIETVNIRTLNLYKAYAETFDARASYRVSTGQRGTFLFSSLASFGNHYKRKVALALPMFEYANVSGFPLKYAGNASVTWDYRRWTVRWSSRFTSQYRVPGPPIAPLSANVLPQGSEFIPAQIYSDVLFGYRFPERSRSGARSWRDYVLSGTEFQLGINNALNKIPPFDVSTHLDYASRGNARLREFSLSVKRPF